MGPVGFPLFDLGTPAGGARDRKLHWRRLKKKDDDADFDVKSDPSHSSQIRESKMPQKWAVGKFDVDRKGGSFKTKKNDQVSQERGQIGIERGIGGRKTSH